ncbi:MAG: Serine/threonine-protein kinase PknD [Phycisphaerae bacterium]|nr:Serine/threonine-protein kinase PknD [Phycisphaerae bacterium]
MLTNGAGEGEGEVRWQRGGAARRPGGDGGAEAAIVPGYGELRELKRGGQGVVYAGVQLSTKRPVAIKLLLDGAYASATARRRFEREIDLVASLRHPNIVSVYDSGTTADGRTYLVMEYIDGVSLDELLPAELRGVSDDLPGAGSAPPAGSSVAVSPARAGTTALGSTQAALRVFQKVCEAVNFAHQRGVIHRDIKPGNVRIDRAGEPHVLDFGLAKISDDGGADGQSLTLSQTGQFMGSLPWASPEQVRGVPGQIDVRSDVYSLGVLFYQLLTGRFPYRVSGPVHDVMLSILHDEPTSPRGRGPGVDDELATIVLKCLAKDAARRYQSAGELARDVERYLAGEPIEAKRDSAWYLVRKKLRRYRTAVSFGAMALVLSLAATVGLAWLWADARAARVRAEQAEGLAETRRVAEADARRLAEKEAQRTAAINAFLATMLYAPAELGNNATVGELLDRALHELGRGELSPDAEAIARRQIGSALVGLGRYEEAGRELDSALGLARETFGVTHTETLSILSDRAWLDYKRGDHAAAERRYREVLEGRRALFGEGDRRLAVTMNDLGIVLEAQGRYDDAYGVLREAHARTVEASGERSEDAINTLGNLANVVHALGRLDEAEGLLRRRLALSRDLRGEQHLETLTAMNNLAVLLSDREKHDAALELSRRVYLARRDMLGAEHPTTLVSMNNLASALWKAGKLGEAEESLRRTAAVQREKLGPDHPETLGTMNNLALLLRDLNKNEEAEAILRRLLETRRAQLGAGHGATLQSMNNLATFLHEAERRGEALPLYRELWQTAREKLGPDHPYAVGAALRLGTALVEERQFADAENLIVGVVAARRRLLGDDDIETLKAQYELGKLRLEQGRAAEALEISDDILRRAGEASGGGEHWVVHVFHALHGRALAAVGRRGEAERELLSAYEAVRARLGAAHTQARQLARRLAEFYDAGGDADAARRFRE